MTEKDKDETFDLTEEQNTPEPEAETKASAEDSEGAVEETGETEPEEESAEQEPAETASAEEEPEEAQESKGVKKFFKKETVSLAKYEEACKQLTKAHEEIESLKESRLRLMAEYDNYKRRTQREKDHLYSDSVADVTKDWLPVLDSLERAALAVDQLDEDSDEDMIQRTADGVALITKQAAAVMEKLGVREIEALGKPFDPVYHEAVMRADASDEDIEPNTIIEVFEKGYIYGDRVIRHSVVKVAN